MKDIIRFIIIALVIAILVFIYCCGKINKEYDLNCIDKDWEKEFEEQEWP